MGTVAHTVWHRIVAGVAVVVALKAAFVSLLRWLLLLAVAWLIVGTLLDSYRIH